MKKLFPFLILGLTLLAVAGSLRAPKNPSEFDVVGFGQLPVLVNGRIKPMDTVARTSLLMIRGRQNVVTPDGRRLKPTEWLLDVFYRSEVADTYRVFKITNPDLLALLGITDDSQRIVYERPAQKIRAIMGMLPTRHRHFSFQELSAHLATIEEQANHAEQVETATRNLFEKAVVRLRDNLVLYQRLKHSLMPPDEENFLAQLGRFEAGIVPGIEAVRARQAGLPHDEAAARLVMEMGQRFLFMERTGYLLAIPPDSAASDPGDWKNSGHVLLRSFQTGRVNPIVLVYAALGQTWRTDRPVEFNRGVTVYREQLAHRYAEELKKTNAETRFNAARPFFTSSWLYCFALLLGVISWLRWPEALGRSAFWLMLIAFLLTTGGIGMRMWLEGRPPVTNLYSSALFVGWGAVALCLVLEKIYRNAIASVAAGAIGFATLLIAHSLSLSGDTLEMMRAVLDDNFWLATHVVVIVIGYSATFLAGFLALIYVLRGVFTQSLDKTTADSLARMVYGIVCFATLFSLVGTVLGGIWADQSWGRFWGWDPKENGALIIVMWNAVILHCRWGGLIRQRGLMALAIVGNIVTAWSWFGVNMLGVGLHSYGFMDEAFGWLVAFVAFQLLVIGLANLPLEKWRSFRAPVPAPATSAGL